MAALANLSLRCYLLLRLTQLAVLTWVWLA